MASSSIYTRTTIEIIKRALKLIRVIDAESPIEGIHRENGIDALNGFIKFLQTEGFNLWRETEALLVLNKGQKKYKLGEAGDHCFNEDDFIYTTLANDYLAGDSLIGLSSITGMAEAKDILTTDITNSVQGWTVTDGTINTNTNLELVNTTKANCTYNLDTDVGVTYIIKAQYVKGTDSGAVFSVNDVDGEISSITLTDSGEIRIEFIARQKKTTFKFENGTGVTGLTNAITDFNYIDKSQGDNIGVFLNDGSIHWSNIIYLSPFEIAQALPGDADKDNTVYTYTDLIPRPTGVNSCRYRANVNFNDIPTTEWTRQQYQDQPDKRTEGTVTKWYYSPQLNNGELYVWQPASNNRGLLPITYIRPLEITDDNVDSMDFPSEWYDLLSYGAASSLLAEYDVTEKVMAIIQAKYTELIDQALGFDNDGAMSIEIDYEGRR